MVDSPLASSQNTTTSSLPSPVAQWVSAEEHRSIMEKLCTTVKQPAGKLPREQSLYLEQQLTDLMGFEVASELDGYQLPHTLGAMSALPHLKRHQQDDLAQHLLYQEAGLSDHRSSFGWFTEMGQLTAEAVAREQYYVSLQIDLLSEWGINAQALKAWYKYRKVVVINPFQERAMVAVVGDFGPGDWIQHQFGGSPEIIRQLEVWDVLSQGRVFVFFVNDPEEKVPLGLIDIRLKL